jgi:hypothetical protein
MRRIEDGSISVLVLIEKLKVFRLPATSEVEVTTRVKKAGTCITSDTVPLMMELGEVSGPATLIKAFIGFRTARKLFLSTRLNCTRTPGGILDWSIRARDPPCLNHIAVELTNHPASGPPRTTFWSGVANGTRPEIRKVRHEEVSLAGRQPGMSYVD